MRVLLCVLFIGLTLLNSALKVAAAADPWIVSTTLGGDRAPITLRLIDSSNQVALPLYIRRANPVAGDQAGATGAPQAATKTIQIIVHLTDKDTGQPLPDYTVNITTGTKDVTDAGLAVPLDGSSVRFVVSLGKLTQIGTFQATLTGQSDEGYQPLTEFTISRFPSPVLTLVGEDSAGALQLAVTKTEFQYTFPIASSKAAKVDKLRVFVSPLLGPGQIPVTLDCKLADKECASAEVEVPALGEAPLSLSAKLPAKGTYTGQITLQYGDKRETKKLTITRDRPAVSVTILNTAAARENSRAEVQVWATLQETGGLQVELDPPQVTELILTDNTAKFQAVFRESKFMTRCDDTSESKTISLQPNEIKTVWLVVCDVAEPGSYSGTLRLSARDQDPVSQSVSFAVKDPIWWAAGLIFIGVLVSYILRSYALLWRPQLDRRERSRQLLDNLEALNTELEQKFGPLDREERRAIDFYATWLQDLDRDLARGRAEKPDDVIVEIDLKLNLLLRWFELRRRIEGLPEPVRESFRNNADWVAASEYLGTKRQPPDAAQAGTEAATQRNKLAALDRTITDELKKHYQGQLDTLRQQVQNWLKQKQVPVDEEQLLKPLNEAQELLDTTRFETFPEVIEQARVRFAQALAQDLDRRIQAVTPPTLPVGFDQPAWDKLKDDVTCSLAPALAGAEPTEVIAAYEKAYDYYLDNLIMKLGTKVSEQKEDAARKLDDLNTDLGEQEENLARAPQDKKADFETKITELKEKIQIEAEKKAQLEDVIKKLPEAQEQRLKKNFFEAEQTYNSALKDYDKVRDKFKLLGAGQGELVEANGALPAGAGAPISPVPALEGVLKKLPSALRLRALRMLGDAGQVIVVAIIAVILGVNLLWVTDITWGSWGDWLTAILWGLGLHQIAGSAFSGIGAINQQLTGQPNR